MANSNEYMRLYMAKRYKIRREAAIDLLGGACVVCGSREHLELDHIERATKSFNLAKAVGFAKTRWDAEVAKCQVLCVTHHKEKTNAELGSERRIHGSYNRWQAGGCRCDVCQAAHVVYCAKRRAQRVANSMAE